jgi:putative ABC transport system permease protein
MPTNMNNFNFFIKFVAVRFNTGSISEALDYSESVWNDIVPNQPFEYIFLDSEIQEMYKAEEKLGVLSKIFSSLAIFIACLGLYALASFTVKQKFKEIGIRKVLGASESNILVIISKEFAVLILAANMIGLPASYYITNVWLNNFAYRIDLSWGLFAVSGLLSLIIAGVTISYQAVKAAGANPVDSLKYE